MILSLELTEDEAVALKSACEHYLYCTQWADKRPTRPFYETPSDELLAARAICKKLVSP